MRRLLLLLLLYVTACASVYAFNATLAFMNDRGYYFFENDYEIIFKGNNILENRKLLGEIPLNKEGSGVIRGIQYSVKKSNLSEFLSEHDDDIKMMPQDIIVLYNGKYSHFIYTIDELMTAGYKWYDRTRFIHDIQLMGAGNLPKEGIYMIKYGENISYVDYGYGIYENCLMSEEVLADTIEVRTYKEQISCIISSTIYYLNTINGTINDELVLLYQPFPISILGEKSDTLFNLCTIEAGTALPNLRNIEIDEKMESLYLYCSSISERLVKMGSMIIDINSLLLPFTIENTLEIGVDHKGQIYFSYVSDIKEEKKLIDIVLHKKQHDATEILQESKTNKSTASNKLMLICLLLILIVAVMVYDFFDKYKKCEDKAAVEVTSDKISSIEIRKKHKKFMGILASILSLILIVTTVLTYSILPYEFFVDLICGGTVINILLYIIPINVQLRKRKTESWVISTLTIDDVNLAEEYVLYLRGFKQDCYMWDGKNTNEFREDKLFSMISKKMKSYAIGMTKELYSPIGASRIYFDEAEWKEGVKILMKHSKYIIINVHDSNNCIYEIEESLRYSYKTICIVTNLDYYNAIKEKFPTIEWPKCIVPNVYFHLEGKEIFKYSPKALMKDLTSLVSR